MKKSMKKITALALSAVTCLCLFAGCGSKAQALGPIETPATLTRLAAHEACASTVSIAAESPCTKVEVEINPGDHVPDFTVTLADGSVFTLSEALKTHKAVLINFWAIYCPHCVGEFPYMQQALEENGQVAAICLTFEDTNEEIRDFMNEKGLTLPLASDSAGLADAFNVQGLPTSILVDRFGNYVFCAMGGMDEGEFNRMFEVFTGDDYTESRVVEDGCIPGPAYSGVYPTDDELSEALCPDGSLHFTYEQTDKELWPFVVSENGITNCNALQMGTYSTLQTTVNAKAGQVFAFEINARLNELADVFDFVVNGEPACELSYCTNTTVAYQFAQDGVYEIELSFTPHMNVIDATAAGTVELSNARLVSGKEAEAALAAQQFFPHALEESAYDLQLLNENAKRITLQLPGAAEDYAEDYTGREYYILPEDTASFRVLLGTAFDPLTAVTYSTSDNAEHCCAVRETDSTGYLFSTPVCNQADGSGFTQVGLYPDMFSLPDCKVICVFHSEEDVNAFIQNGIRLGHDGDTVPASGVTWTYADGTKPSTDQAAQAAQSSARYTITMVDENGEPVIGCMINICSDKTCNPQRLSDTNTFSFDGINGEMFAYVVHVIKVPSGYTFDTTQAFTLNAAGDTLTITVPHV